MPQSISTIEGYLSSTNKLVRLKALKLLLRHPDASPIQLVRALCSDDNRDFEFLEVFELDYAMRQSWTRLRGVTDDEVYQYLSALYVADPARNIHRRDPCPGTCLHSESFEDAAGDSCFRSSIIALVNRVDHRYHLCSASFSRQLDRLIES